MEKIGRLISTLGPVGFSNALPGTTASFLSLIIWAPLIFAQINQILYFSLVFVSFLISWAAFKISKNTFESKDPKEVVSDEFMGQGLALLFCPPNWVFILLGFILFRFFDILKPWPISFIDKNIKSPFGVMFDDALAGGCAAFVLWLIVFCV